MPHAPDKVIGPSNDAVGLDFVNRSDALARDRVKDIEINSLSFSTAPEQSTAICSF